MAEGSDKPGVTMVVLRRHYSPVHGTIFHPGGKRRGRAVILVIGGSEGGEPWPQAVAM